MSARNSRTMSQYFLHSLPLILAYAVLFMYFVVWCGIESSRPITNINDLLQGIHKLPGQPIYKNYLTATTFLVLIIAELSVILFSIYSTYVRKKFSNEFEIYTDFFIPFFILAVISLVTSWIFGWICATAIHPMETIGRDVIQHMMGEGPYYLLYLSLIISGFLAFLAISAIFSAACTLFPRQIFHLNDCECDRDKLLSIAKREIAYQIRWMKYYLFAAALLLIVGVHFLKTWTELPLAYIDEDNLAGLYAYREYTERDSSVQFVFLCAASGSRIFFRGL